jgi:hypothetical protein
MFNVPKNTIVSEVSDKTPFEFVTQQHAKQHAYNQQQIQYHDSVHQVTNATILNFDFNLYDKIISFTVLHILQI